MRKTYRIGLALLTSAALIAQPASAQSPAPHLTVDSQGTIRRTSDNSPGYYFGVNYTAPFAYSYRALKRRGIDIRRAIDMDVEQMARLKLNGYRIHVWDREISDRAGNLLQNEHLELLDYLLARLAERKIAVVLTPIAWWATGWPEPDPKAPGFAELYTKQQMNTDPKAIAASENYIRQLMSHVNRETGRRYVDDPNIVGVELFNEPKHDADAATGYINRLVRPVRELGYQGPIFYNISEQGNRPGFAAAVCASNVQGVSYQWYPTGLVRGSTIRANTLPNVRVYELPFRGVGQCDRKARMVYEFDAADVAGSTMYPAMADAFRRAGFQWATQFAYDPSHIADSNTEYPTHYLNLLYTPSKAISFLIAGEVFRNGRAPDLKLSYAEDRSELATGSGFFHSSATSTRPPQPGRLREIAGVGSSPLVAYGGNGAYFLDKLRDGVWLLELFPDVIEHSDPFGKVSEERQVRRLVASERQMRLRLPDLGDRFEISALAQGQPRRRAAAGAFQVTPGKYLLSRRAGARLPEGIKASLPVPPIPAAPAIGLSHKPCSFAPSGRALRLRAMPIATGALRAANLHVRRPGHSQFTSFPMKALETGEYEALIPADSPVLQPGRIEYSISVDAAHGSRTFPGAAPGRPGDWNFTGDEVWTTDLMPHPGRVSLFDPADDMRELLLPRWRSTGGHSVDLVPGGPGRDLVLQVKLAAAPTSAAAPFALRAGAPRMQSLCGAPTSHLDALRFTARSASGGTHRARVAVVTSDGTAWGGEVLLGPTWQEHRLPLASLKPVPVALLPNAYPLFQPDFEKEPAPARPLTAAAVEGVQVEIHPTAAAHRAGWTVEMGEVTLTD